VLFLVPRDLLQPREIRSPSEVAVKSPLVIELVLRNHAEAKRLPLSLDSSQKPILLWLEPYTLVEEKDHDLDGYLFDDSCLRVS